MSEQLLVVITKYLDKIGSGIETAIEYALKEAPDLFQEYLLYRTIEEIHSAVICGVFTIPMVICFFVGLDSIKTIYQIKLTPKAYMIDRVSGYLACKNRSGQNGNCRL